MSKSVRIENADTSSYKVVVQIWDKGNPGGPSTPAHPDVMVEEKVLGYPTALAEIGIHSSRYLVIKERD